MSNLSGQRIRLYLSVLESGTDGEYCQGLSLHRKGGMFCLIITTELIVSSDFLD